jgi:hypothetical protein
MRLGGYGKAPSPKGRRLTGKRIVILFTEWKAYDTSRLMLSD